MKTGRKSQNYRLELDQTAGSTGFFSAIPESNSDFEEMLDYICLHPADSFMHLHLLGLVGRMTPNAALDLLESEAGQKPVVRALLLEAGMLNEHLADIGRRFKRREMKPLAEKTPLIFLRSISQKDQSLHAQWAELIRTNLTHHRPLAPPEKIGLPLLFDVPSPKDTAQPKNAHLSTIMERMLPDLENTGEPRRPMEKTITLATQRLEMSGILEGEEMRHQSALSPIALLRKWRLSHSVKSGALNYSLSSVQTAYGRGLSLKEARASCLMEVVERCSAFVSVDHDGIIGTRRPHPLLHGSRSQLSAQGLKVLDPNRLNLEVPYKDDPLFWIEGEQKTSTGTQNIWVPAQSIFLFCNLDERSLFSGLGSTGLASGNTMSEARLSALYELIERDNEAINPFHPARCFRVHADDNQLSALFEDYRQRGLHLFFQDISPDYGIPGCLCFVVHQDGTVTKGASVNLSGKRAVISSMTETPYPYPTGPASAPAPADLPWLQFESLPDFSTNKPDCDLQLVEQTLLANGFSPIYVELTRKDLDIPVVKALVPGFELMADFDQFSRISPRLFNNYLKIHEKQ